MWKVYLNGKEVALLLRIKRMSQKDFAQRAHITQVHISRLINQQCPVGIKTQKEIQRVFKCIPFDRIFTMVDKI